MQYNLSNEIEVQLLREHIEYLIEREREVELNIIYPQKSNSQLAYLHVLIGMIFDYTGYTKEEIKRILGFCDNNGNVYSFADLNKKQMHVFIEILNKFI